MEEEINKNLNQQGKKVADRASLNGTHIYKYKVQTYSGYVISQLSVGYGLNYYIEL